MSTWWYFECHSHDPILTSDGEFTQHTDDKHYKLALELANSRPLDPEFNLDNAIFQDDDAAHFGGNMIRFLRDHPKCDLKIIDEYGKREDIPPTSMTVRMLMNRLSKFDGNMFVRIRGRQGDAVMVVDDGDDDKEIEVLENDYDGNTIFA